MGSPTAPLVHVALSGDVYLKSRRTQKRLIPLVRENLEASLRATRRECRLERIGTHRFAIHTMSDDDGAQAAIVSAASHVFGIGSVDTVVELPSGTIEDIARSVADAMASSVSDRRFAVRVKRRGNHEWRSPELAAAAGALLVAAGGRVDLSDPEVEVRVQVVDHRVHLVTEHRRGAGGLPIGAQDRVLCLVSGGFDSVVAAWMLMSRGCSVDFVHFALNCAQSDHALAVAGELWRAWGHGSSPTVHLVEFQPVKDALIADVEPRMRQVALKVMMARAASEIAQEAGILALVTGDAMGQVSSQTLPHLVAVSEAADVPILRPLLGMPKESIIDLARRIGTADLSARAQEVCDLSEGRPVATAAGSDRVAASVAQVPGTVMADAVMTRKSFSLADWSPGGF